MAEKQATLPRLDLRALPGPDTIRRRELPNGIVILARENFASPSVVISGYLSVGALDERPEQAGLADLTASALLRGTRGRSFQQIFESLESIGASLGFGSGKHTTGFQGKSLAEDLGLILDLLCDALRMPTFPKRQVDRLRGEKLTSLAIRDQDTGARAQQVFHQLAYPNHPYSVPSDGFRETVEPLGPADLKSFHTEHYGPQGMVISVVGAVEAEAALEAVESRLGTWRNLRQMPQPPLPPVKPLRGIRRKRVVLRGKSQCDLVLGAPGPSRSDPDFLAAALGNSVLGRFGMMGRIGDAVREAEGLAYYAYSNLSGGTGPGPWQVMAGVNPANVERAIEIIRREIRRFVKRPITQQELLDNQANFIGRLPLQLESNEGVAAALVYVERHGLGLDYYRRYPDLVASLTREQVLQAARRFLHPDRLAIGVAGPPKDAS